MKVEISQTSRNTPADLQEQYAAAYTSLAEGPFTFEKGKIYLVEIIEKFSQNLEGRIIVAPGVCLWMLNVRCRPIWLTEEGERALWLELIPFNYPLAVNFGQSIANIRLCSEAHQELETISSAEQSNLLRSAIRSRPGERGVIVAGKVKGIPDLSEGLACLEQVDWQAAPDWEDGVILEPHKLYIVPIHEQEIRTEGTCAAELVPFDPRTDKLQLWRRLFLPTTRMYNDRMVLRKNVIQGFAVPFHLADAIPIGFLRYRELEHPRPQEDIQTPEDEEIRALFIDRDSTH